MKQWQHIFFKHLRYEPCVVVLRCLPSEQGVGLANFKKKSEGPGPMGLDLLEISNNYCGVMDAFRGLKLIICRDIGLI